MLIVVSICLVMALANRTLIRIDQDLAPDVLEEIDLNKVFTKNDNCLNKINIKMWNLNLDLIFFNILMD